MMIHLFFCLFFGDYALNEQLVCRKANSKVDASHVHILLQHNLITAKSRWIDKHDFDGVLVSWRLPVLIASLEAIWTQALRPQRSIYRKPSILAQQTKGDDGHESKKMGRSTPQQPVLPKNALLHFWLFFSNCKNITVEEMTSMDSCKTKIPQPK